MQYCSHLCFKIFSCTQPSCPQDKNLCTASIPKPQLINSVFISGNIFEMKFYYLKSIRTILPIWDTACTIQFLFNVNDVQKLNLKKVSCLLAEYIGKSLHFFFLIFVRRKMTRSLSQPTKCNESGQSTVHVYSGLQSLWLSMFADC